MATVLKKNRNFPEISYIFRNNIAFKSLLCYHNRDVFAPGNAPTAS